VTLKKKSGRRWAPAVVIGLAAVFVISACSSNPAPPTSGTKGLQASVGGGIAAPAQAAKVTLKPAAGEQNVAPSDPVQIAVTDGTINSVTLTNADGKQVAGAPAADKRSWTTTEALGFGKTYDWGGEAVGRDGKTVPISGSFTTLTPRIQVSASLNVGDGQTYGIAMPIVVAFNGTKVTDKAAVEKTLKVETTPTTEGSWAWLNGDTAAHWRPKEYFKPGTTVRVEAKIYGIQIANGAYGSADLTSNFTIGRSQIVRGNTQQHTMQVIRDGQQVAQYPVSYGLDSDPGRVTNSGIHVVMSKSATYSMSNPRYGYTDVNVPWAVRISNNGEFIHGLAASVWAQGKKNISHGCLNLSPQNAKAYFDSVLPGDPVEISGSTQQLGAKDGDYSDWTYSWADWTKLSAINR
jgi:lipoprotein-anchoring transpeptidase ErfK/SrfK